jgi:hypothetical protein
MTKTLSPAHRSGACRAVILANRPNVLQEVPGEVALGDDREGACLPVDQLDVAQVRPVQGSSSIE